jgi:DNA-binding NarL/FixJ family response regulator
MDRDSTNHARHYPAEQLPVAKVRQYVPRAKGKEGSIYGNASTHHATQVFNQPALVIEQQCPDVVLMDIRMPGCDGITALQRLCDTGNPIPVLLLTTFDDHETILQLMAAGLSNVEPPVTRLSRQQIHTSLHVVASLKELYYRGYRLIYKAIAFVLWAVRRQYHEKPKCH